VRGSSFPDAAAACRVRPHDAGVAFGVTGESSETETISDVTTIDGFIDVWQTDLRETRSDRRLKA
jgi:hypothetical protein